MVIFLPLRVTSAVPGGLGRLLLSSGVCWASASDATASRTIETPTVKYFCPFICVSFREKPRYHRPDSSAKWDEPKSVFGHELPEGSPKCNRQGCTRYFFS